MYREAAEGWQASANRRNHGVDEFVFNCTVSIGKVTGEENPGPRLFNQIAASCLVGHVAVRTHVTSLWLSDLDCQGG